ncbi:MAG TPA: hypothetical protein VK116_14255 [Planctomycetota bacterium]|nr:hypothetical protein [Planctomycetota bacterium]
MSTLVAFLAPDGSGGVLASIPCGRRMLQLSIGHDAQFLLVDADSRRAEETSVWEGAEAIRRLAQALEDAFEKA